MTLVFRWDGSCLLPLRPKDADKELVIGRNYRLDDSMPGDANRIRGMEFAFLHEAWSQLPERMIDRYPTETHLRKAALIHTGHRKQTVIHAGSEKAALDIAALWRSEDVYAVVIVEGEIVTRLTALSQANAGDMDLKTLKQSRNDVLGWLANLIGVTPATLDREAGKSA